MHIGFFTDTFLPQRNGVVTSILSFGPELVKRGYEVSVFCSGTDLSEYEGMKIYSYPSLSFGPYPEYMIAMPSGSDAVPKIDIAHMHSPFAMGIFGLKVSKRQKVPRVATFHTLLPEYAPEYLRRIAIFGRWLLKKLMWRYCRGYYNRHRKVIAPSNSLKRILEEHGIKSPIEVIPTGIDTNFFRPTDKERARRKLGLEGERIFLYLGRLGYEKHVDDIIRAFRGVDANLIIAGQGIAEEKLKELCQELGLGGKISFVGYVPEELKPLYYSAADALVIASTSETQGLVIIEAMACGCPVIGADSPAMAEIIKDGGNGYRFAPHDSEHLAEILLSYEANKRMRSHALKKGRQFSVQKCVDKLENLYLNLQDRTPLELKP